MALVEYRQEDSIAYITLNRPEKLNAFSDEVGVAFCDSLYRFNDDAEARVGIISGNGRAFCSGADVRQRQMRAKEEMHLTEDFRESAAAFLEKRKPVYHGR